MARTLPLKEQATPGKNLERKRKALQKELFLSKEKLYESF
jgi:hypothetical protein